MQYGLKTTPAADADVGMISATGFTIDDQGRHATVFIPGDDARPNTPGTEADGVNLQQSGKVAR